MKLNNSTYFWSEMEGIYYPTNIWINNTYSLWKPNFWRYSCNVKEIKEYHLENITRYSPDMAALHDIFKSNLCAKTFDGSKAVFCTTGKTIWHKSGI